MYVTFEVLKLLKSRNVKDWQLLNMNPIFVTLEVLKLLRLREANERQS